MDRKIIQKCLFFSLFISICFIFQCGFPSSTLAIKQGGILKVAIGKYPVKPGDPPNTLATADFSIGCNVFEQLVTFDYDEKTKKTTPEPYLAEKWEYSKDGKAWTFYLRKGVNFHDGTPFNAEAVKFNIDRLAADKPRTIYGGDLRAVVDHTEVVDEYTVKVYLKKPVPIFLDLMGQFYASISSPTAVKKHGDKISRYPTGTGPFKFVKWISGDYIELKVNKEYWGGRAPLDGIIIRFVPDNNARINMLQTKGVDVAYNIPLPDIKRLRKTGKIDIISWPISMMMRLYLDTAYTPTNESEVRQAIKIAIDRKAIVRDILEGNGKVAEDSVVTPYSWGYYPVGPSVYDPEKAKKLLSEAGWIDKGGDGIREKEDTKLALTIYSPPPGHYLMGGECTLAIQEYLRQVGFHCSVEFMDYSAFMARFYRTKDKTKGGAYFIAWSSRTDAWFVLFTRLHSSKWHPDKKHTTFYRNTEFDKFVDKAATEINPKKRFELYKKAQIIAACDNPMINLWQLGETLGKRKYVHGLKVGPVPIHNTYVNAREAWME